MASEAGTAEDRFRFRSSGLCADLGSTRADLYRLERRMKHVPLYDYIRKIQARDQVVKTTRDVVRRQRIRS